MARLPVIEKNSVRGAPISDVVARPSDLGLGVLAKGVIDYDEGQDALSKREAQDALEGVIGEYEPIAIKTGEAYQGEVGLAKSQEEAFSTLAAQRRVGLSGRALGHFDELAEGVKKEVVSQSANMEARFTGRLIKDQNEAHNEAEVQQKLVDAQIKWSERYQEALNDGSALSPQFDQIDDDARKADIEAIMAQTPPEQQAALIRGLSSIETRYQLNRSSEQVQAREKNIVQKARDNANALGNFVLSDPRKLGEATMRLNEIAGTLPVSMRSPFLSDGLNLLYVNKSNAFINADDFEGLEVFLKDKATQGIMSATAYEQAKSQLDRYNTSESRGQAQINLQGLIDDNTARLQTTGQAAEISEKEFTAAFGSKKGAQQYQAYQKSRRAAQEHYNYLKRARSWSPADMQNWLEANKPNPQNAGYAEELKNYNATISWWNKQQEERLEDPAAAVGDVKKEEYGNYVSGAPGAAEAWAGAAISQQKIWGLNPRIVPKDMAQNIIATVKNAAPGKKVEAMMGVVGHVKSYGRFDGQVLRELQGAGLDGPDAAMVVMAMNKKPAILRAYGEASERLKGVAFDKKMKEKLGISVGKEMEGLRKSYGYSPDGTNFAKDLEAGVATIARAKIADGISQDEAVKQAVKMVQSNYHISPTGIRIPKQIYDQAKSDQIGMAGLGSWGRAPNKILQGTEAVLRGVVRDDGAGLYAAKRFPNLTEAQNRKLYADEVLSTARWVSEDDDSGARLVIPNGAGGWQTVLNKDKKPMRYSWAELMGKGK